MRAFFRARRLEYWTALAPPSPLEVPTGAPKPPSPPSSAPSPPSPHRPDDGAGPELPLPPTAVDPPDPRCPSSSPPAVRGSPSMRTALAVTALAEPPLPPPLSVAIPSVPPLVWPPRAYKPPPTAADPLDPCWPSSSPSSCRRSASTISALSWPAPSEPPPPSPHYFEGFFFRIFSRRISIIWPGRISIWPIVGHDNAEDDCTAGLVCRQCGICPARPAATWRCRSSWNQAHSAGHLGLTCRTISDSKSS